MNVFCRIFGHTYVASTEAPEPRWNTTKAGVVLVQTAPAGAPRYFEQCRRCGEQRDAQLKLPAGALRESGAGSTPAQRR